MNTCIITKRACCWKYAIHIPLVNIIKRVFSIPRGDNFVSKKSTYCVLICCICSCCSLKHWLFTPGVLGPGIIWILTFLHVNEQTHCLAVMQFIYMYLYSRSFGVCFLSKTIFDLYSRLFSSAKYHSTEFTDFLLTLQITK